MYNPAYSFGRLIWSLCVFVLRVLYRAIKWRIPVEFLIQAWIKIRVFLLRKRCCFKNSMFSNGASGGIKPELSWGIRNQLVSFSARLQQIQKTPDGLLADILFLFLLLKLCNVFEKSIVQSIRETLQIFSTIGSNLILADVLLDRRFLFIRL